MQAYACRCFSVYVSVYVFGLRVYEYVFVRLCVCVSVILDKNLYVCSQMCI